MPTRDKASLLFHQSGGALVNMGIWIKWLSEIQPLVLRCILIWAGAWKIGVSSASQAALKSALANIVSPRIAQLSHRFLGLIEFAVGWALLLPPNCKGEKFGVLALGLGFLLSGLWTNWWN